MRDELSGVLEAIERASLPSDATTLFGTMWDRAELRFVAQETYVADFKDKVPTQFSAGFGAAITRLALAFHNTFGGVIVFGVNDGDLTCVGDVEKFDIEAFNEFLSEITAARIECLSREYSMPGTADRVCVVLVPRRGATRPVETRRQFDKFPAGTIWVRDRHSVRLVSESDLPLLFSSRRDLAKSLLEDQYRSVHESLPPSPATVRKFIGRSELLLKLWDWFVFDDKPRFYLHGPGGSGKSTLAYEFSRQVADRGAEVAFADGDHLDYVIFISGKETELNPHSAGIQKFAYRNFDDAEAQFRSILSESGLISREQAAQLPQAELPPLIQNLFNTYSGLIVIDDVDALSRRGKDTGEEQLFLAAIRASHRTRILYTLRHPPPAALSASLRVPELDRKSEFPVFVETCAAQFDVPQPDKRELKTLEVETSRLPLLVETVVGLRDVCGSYKEAFSQFKDRGGEAARQYLYQREYDRLEDEGRSREMLAALLLLQEPVTFEVLTQVLGVRSSAVSDAIGECAGIFMNTSESARGDTLYQLASPARLFISNISTGLKHFGTLKRRVELFRAEEAAYSPEESAFIVEMQGLVRMKKYRDAADAYEGRGRHDPVLANPRVQSLAGQAYANLGPDFRTRARECFKSAYDLGHADIYMMRSWIFLETTSEYGLRDAIALLEDYLRRHRPARDRAEIQSKLGYCYQSEARRLRRVAPEKAVELYQKAVDANLSALWIGRRVPELSEDLALDRLAAPARELISMLGDDLAPFFDLIDRLTERQHDVHVEGARILLQALQGSSAGRDPRARSRIAGLMRRTIKKLETFVGRSDDYPGFELLIEMFTKAQADLSAKATAS